MSRRSIRIFFLVAAVALALAAAHVAADRSVPPLATRGTLTTATRTAEDPSQPDTGCDASAGGEVDELIADQPIDRTIPTPLPTQWYETRHRGCHRYSGRRACDGPRRVPVPFGPAAELARSIGLTEPRAAHVALSGQTPDGWLQAARGQIGAGLLWPVPEGRLWRGFGAHRRIIRARHGRLRRGRRMHHHQGVDIGANPGSAIRAVNDGLVIYSWNGMSGYGNAVVLLHADGSTTLYGHCRATLVFPGQRVRRGQVIAEVGATGLAHGPHCHFEWHRNGRAVNPLAHFVGAPPEVARQLEEP